MKQRVSELASRRVGAAKWIGKWLLQIPVYLVTSYLIRTLIGSCYRLLIKAGADLPPNYLLEHFLIVGAIGGFLAGLIGVVVFRAAMLLPQKPQRISGPLWRRPQVWTWALPFCFLLFGIMAWYGGHAHRSVLATSAGESGSDLIGAFFGQGCDVRLVGMSQWILQTCMNQLTFTHAFVGTLGYSIAAFIPPGWLMRLRRSDRATTEPEGAGDEIPNQDEQGQIAHS